MRKVCVIGQFPPPVHGLSKALDTMYRGLESDFQLEKVDLTDNKKIPINLWKIARSKADVFYFTLSQTVGGNKRDLLLLKLIAAKKKKCVVHLHGGYYRSLVENEMGERQRLANFKAMQKVSAAIVLSPSLRGIFEGMVSDERIYSVPNCIDDEFLLPCEALEEKLCRDKDGYRVLYLSNFNVEKGYRHVLELAKEEKKRVERGEKRLFTFDFAGAFFDEAEREFFFASMQENGLDDYVCYHGVVTGERKRALLQKDDIFILPTRYPKEGQPISVLESMGNGMAVVTTDHAAIGDTVRDGENGVLCTTGEESDYESLYDRMVAMLPDLPAIGRRNHERISQDYTEAEYLQNLRTILNNC